MALPDQDIYFASVPTKKRFKLDKKLDFDHDGVQKNLGTIANSMDEWEGSVAEQLQLTKPEIQAIRKRYPGELQLQTRAALQKWQEKFGPMATYRALIVAFVRAGKGDFAEAVVKVLGDNDVEPERHHVLQDPMHRYAMYLRGVYESALVSSDKFPNLTCNEFINLALVKGDRVTRSEADEFTKATLHGHIDEILQRKEPIKLEEVLKPVEGQRKTKCVYVYGAPGVGKSTCVGELCRRWDEIDSLKKYSLVILLRLREKRVQEAQNIQDICYHDDKELQQAVAAEIKAREGKDIMFILDGFDELPASLQKHSIYVKLIQGTFLSHCIVLVTSRPSATANLFSVAQPQIHKQVEVIGFTQAHIEQYAKAFFASQPDVLADFLTYITTHPAIKSLMYIPLNCAITAETYRHNRTVNRPIPQTITQLYTEMSLTLLQRHLDEEDPLINQLPERLEDLPPQLSKPFCSLAKLAFDGLKRNEVIFHGIPNSFVHLGFMNTPTELYMGRKSLISYSFLHLTFQEFLAAFHISQLSPDDQKSVFKEQCTIIGWHVVWRFVAGLTGFCGIGWEEVVKFKTPIVADMSAFLIEYLYEAQEKIDYDSVLGLLGGSEVNFPFLSFWTSLSAFDCYAVGYCVAKSKCLWKLNMSFCQSLGNTLVEMLKHGLSCNLPPKEHANIISLKLVKCGLNSIAFDQLADIIPLMTNLKELDISNNPAGDGGLVKLLHSLSHLKRLQTLHMCYIQFGLADIEALSNLISPSSICTLKKLEIGEHFQHSGNTTSEDMLNAVFSPSSLESLKLYNISWAGHDLHAITLLKDNNNLNTLEIDLAKSGFICSVARALCTNSHLKVLDITYHGIYDDLPTCTDTEFIASIMLSMLEMVCANRTLETVKFKHGPITMGELLALNSALQSNHTLKTIELPKVSFDLDLVSLDSRISFEQQ